MSRKYFGHFRLQSFVTCKEFRNSATQSMRNHFPYNASRYPNN